METVIEEFCRTLSSLDSKDDDLVNKLYDATDLLDGVQDISKAFGSIFGFIEKSPTSDFGVPGPLVHLLEGYFPNYVPRLIESIKNKPTSVTVFMMNRLLNTELSPEERGQYLLLLKSVTENEIADSMVKEEALEFYNYQTSGDN